MLEARMLSRRLVWPAIATLAVSVTHAAEVSQSAPLPAAADPARASSATLQEVTVTAERRSENLQRVPISIVAVSRATIAALGAKSLEDLAGVAPSLTFGESNNQGQLGIRGITDASRDAGVDARAGIYIDGVFLGRSWMNNVPLIDIDHVEVLNGPQGTLFGKNTDAGAVSIVTRQPSVESSAETVIDVGNFGYHSASAYLTGPLAGAHGLTASLSVGKTDSSGYMTNAYYDKHMDGLDHSAARAKVRYAPSDSFDIEQSLDWMRARDSTVFYTQKAPAGADPYIYTSPNSDFENNEMYGTTSTATFRLASGFKWVNIADFRRASRETDLNGEGDTVPGVPLATVIGDYPEQARQASEELRLVSPVFSRFDFVTGLYYFHLKDAEDFALTLGPGFAALGPPFSFYANDPVHSVATTYTSSYAGYLTGNYRIGAGFELSAGVRYTIDHKSLAYSMLDQHQIILGYAPDIADGRTFHNTSPKIGLNYHLARSVMLYASYAEGFKSGGWAADFDTNAQIAAGLRVEPETARDYEVGLKSALLGDRLRLDADVFEEKFANFQVFQVRQRMAGGKEIQETSLTNAGRVTSKGAELQLAGRVFHYLTLTANLTYDDSYFDSFPGGGGPYQGRILDATGAKTPYAPLFKGYGAADLDLPVGSGVFDLLLHADYRGQGKSESDASYINPTIGHLNDIPAYHTVNVRAGLMSQSGRWEVDLWCKNISNETYWLFSEAPTIGSFPLVDYAPPRAYGVTLTTHL